MTGIKPDQFSKVSKKNQVEEMFNGIAKNYDFLNHFLSLGIDKIWRKKAINYLKTQTQKPENILDIATGTADLALEIYNQIKPKQIIGIDISEEMLEVGRKKILSKNLSNKIDLKKGDGEKLQFDENIFDAVTVAFGVRNFENLEKGLTEIFRVLKPSGKLVILEFSNPKSFPIKQIFNLYFKYILPFLGKLISKSQLAYSYLPESVMHFAEGEEFCNHLRKCGFKNIIAKGLSFGTCTIYVGEK